MSMADARLVSPATGAINPAVLELFATKDGALPDIVFDFHGARVAAAAYAVVQRHAAALASPDATYWSLTAECDCPIVFGGNPAALVVSGEVQGFHVVFGGLSSRHGATIPDLGVFVWADDCVALDYPMGPAWTIEAIVGLFELMHEIAMLADGTSVTHDGNILDESGRILLDAFDAWRRATHSCSSRRTGRLRTPPALPNG